MKRLSALLMFLVSFTGLLVLLPAQGLTDDDDFYVPASISYANWATSVFTQPRVALSGGGIDRAFKPNHEHPPFAKYVMGASYLAKSWWLGDMDATRAGVALMAAILCAFLVLWLWDPLGPAAALIAPLMLLSLPRFFFHSQVATLDVPVATMVVVTCAIYMWSERSNGWAWWAGLAFGLALLTKLNAPFVAIPAVLYALAQRWRGFRISGGGLQIPPIPRALIIMALMGPVIFFVLWPWLWATPISRLGAYFAFHLRHYPIYLFYGGEIFSKPFAPPTAVFHLAAAVIPLPLLVLGAVGGVEAVRALWRILVHADEGGAVPGVSARDKLLAFVLLQAAFAIGVVAFSNVPKYGGAKLFMPFFPLFCVLAAAGLQTMLQGVRRAAPSLPRPRDMAPRPRPAHRQQLAAAVVFAVGLAACLPGAIGSARFHGGFGLSYYSGFVGGLRGATARGFERTYYDIADKELARWLTQNAGKSAVHFEPNHKEYVRTYRWLKRQGLVSRHLRLERDRKRAEILVLTHERRWSTYPALLDEHRKLKRVYEKRIDGVPLYTVYRR